MNYLNGLENASIMCGCNFNYVDGEVTSGYYTKNIFWYHLLFEFTQCYKFFSNYQYRYLPAKVVNIPICPNNLFDLS